MDFSIPEDVVSVSDLAGQILSGSVDDAGLKAFDRGEIRWQEKAWSLLAEAGLIGVALPEPCGGSGLGLLALCAVLEQQGKHVAALPLLATAVLGALPLARFGSDAQQSAWLPRVIDGSAVLSSALALSPLDHSPRSVPAQRVDGDVVQLDGELESVPWGADADAVLVAARASDGVLDVYLVERGTPGLSAEVERGTDYEPFAVLRFDSVRVPASSRVGAAGEGEAILAWIAERSAVAHGYRQLGVLAEALRRTASHTVERRQFGKPLAAFQAVAHRAADAYIDLEALRTTLWQAVWRLEQGVPAADAVATAAWWAGEAGHRVSHSCQHLHGGVGADVDYPIHRYYLWAQQHRLCLGGSARILADFGARLSTQQIEIGL